MLRKIRNRLELLIRGQQFRDRIVIKRVDSRAEERLQPAFLIAPYRSGTTLLRFILDSHSRIAVPPESNFLWHLGQMGCSQWVCSGMQGLGVHQDEILPRIGSFAWELLDDYARAKGKSRWVDKTPAYVDILDLLPAMFGESCRFIMLYRHGLDVAHSLANLYEKGVLGGPVKDYGDAGQGSPQTVFARYWADKTEKMLAFEESNPDLCYRIYYEGYAGRPKEHLPQLFDFLGEQWEPEVLDFAGKQHDFGLQDHKITEKKGFAPSGGSFRSWSQEDLERGFEICAPIMQRLGYPERL